VFLSQLLFFLLLPEAFSPKTKSPMPKEGEKERHTCRMGVLLPQLPLFLLKLEAFSFKTDSFMFNKERGKGLAVTWQCSFPNSPSFFEG
jgi:hypothetical protein